MAYIGHCNCESVRLTLAQQPPHSVIRHCTNCKKAGGAFSINYAIGYKDSGSGNIVERCFCSNCGSPAATTTPMTPGRAFLKATLFDTIAPSGGEVFPESRLEWLSIEQAREKQA